MTDVRSPGDTRHRHPAADLPLAVMAAVVLDAWRPLPAWGGFPWRWLDAVALACVAGVAWLESRRETRVCVTTPLDLNLLALVVLGLVMVIPEHGRAESIEWLHVGVPCLIVYFTTVITSRRTGALPSLGPAIAVALIAPGLFAVWGATRGLHSLALQSAAIDVAWSAHHGVFKLLAMSLPLAASRAFEPGARPLWRTALVVGAVGLVLQTAADGSGLAASAFDRLSEPLFFSNLIVAMLLIVTVMRTALSLSRTDPSRARRWRGVAASFAVLGVLAALGEVSAGAAVRALAALGAGTVMAAAEAPDRAEPEDVPAPVALDEAA